MQHVRGEAVAVEPHQPARRERRKPLYRQLKPRRNGLGRDAVAADQRRRLIGAMIEVAGSERGYRDANIRLLSELAGVSRQTFYDRFGTVEACFLASYDFIVRRAVKRLDVAYAREGDWRARLGGAFLGLAALSVAEPKAARLVLVEAPVAGPRAVSRVEQTRTAFERILCASFNEEGVRLPPLVARGIVGGMERIMRQRVLAGEVAQLPLLADELLEWTLSYRSPALARMTAQPACPPSPRRRRVRSSNPRARILRAAACIAASKGYAGLTPTWIAAVAEVSLETFEAFYPSVERCFLDALDRLALEALVAAAAGARTANGGRSAVNAGIVALIAHIASDPALMRVASVEVAAVGPKAVAHRELLLGRFGEALFPPGPDARRPSDLVVEAIVGAIWGIVEHNVIHGDGRHVPAMAAPATYLALAPLVGAEAAVGAILAGAQTA